jgi:hypothetical protein
MKNEYSKEQDISHEIMLFVEEFVWEAQLDTFKRKLIANIKNAKLKDFAILELNKLSNFLQNGKYIPPKIKNTKYRDFPQNEMQIDTSWFNKLTSICSTYIELEEKLKIKLSFLEMMLKKNNIYIPIQPKEKLTYDLIYYCKERIIERLKHFESQKRKEDDRLRPINRKALTKKKEGRISYEIDLNYTIFAKTKGISTGMRD